MKKLIVLSIIISSCFFLSSTVLAFTPSPSNGPSGGIGGNYFLIGGKKENSIPVKIEKIIIHAGTLIDSIAISYKDKYYDDEFIGGSGGQKHVFHLEEDEYIIGISGKHGRYIHSLQIHTNKRISRKYGGDGGDAGFGYIAPKGYKIYAFIGRSGVFIDAIGVIYTAP